MLALKLLLTITYSQMGKVSLPIMTGVAVATGVLWCTMYLYFIPYYAVCTAAVRARSPRHGRLASCAVEM
jgi:hypothetical protein